MDNNLDPEDREQQTIYSVETAGDRRDNTGNSSTSQRSRDFERQESDDLTCRQNNISARLQISAVNGPTRRRLLSESGLVRRPRLVSAVKAPGVKPGANGGGIRGDGGDSRGDGGAEIETEMRTVDPGSSEEELEEININKDYIRVSTEKRKWSDLTNSEPSSESDLDLCDFMPSEADVNRCSPRTDVSSCGTLSEDEDLNHNKVVQTPVEFFTSPPVDAHKPRRSHSPQHKLLGFSNQQQLQQQQPACQLASQPQQLLGQPLPLDRQLGDPVQAATRRIAGLSTSLGDLSRLSMDQVRSERRIFSPRKKSRKAHLLPRPCLDFEKMQQMQAVTSWKGGELSLFCW